VVEHLVSLGANVNAKSQRGSTPIHGAAENGYLPIVEFLLTSDADVRRCCFALKKRIAILLERRMHNSPTPVAGMKLAYVPSNSMPLGCPLFDHLPVPIIRSIATFKG
jgi:ankyrin repeat protein